jgi:prepilin-type N-terminal cleavage/methylation domain-containing protein
MAKNILFGSKKPVAKTNLWVTLTTHQQHPSKLHQNMKLPRPPKGFTLIELLVVISIIAVLASLAVPAVTGALVKGQLIQAVNNVRQIHLATTSMANDGTTNSDTALGWPGDLVDNVATSTVSDLTTFVNQLVKYDYLKAGDLKVFAAAGITAYTVTSGSGVDATGSLTTPFTITNSAFNVYEIRDTDDSTALFLATKNFNPGATSGAGTIVSGTAKPFGDKGFVVCRKGGDASVYKKQQATKTDLYASPVPIALP